MVLVKKTIDFYEIKAQWNWPTQSILHKIQPYFNTLGSKLPRFFEKLKYMICLQQNFLVGYVT